MRLFVALLFVLAATPAAAEQYFSTKATHAVILDGETGAILYEKGAEEAIPPASMSKLMTAAIVLDLIDKGQLDWDTAFTVSEKAWRTGGSKMFVLVDTTITVENLLKGLIVQSGNDAAVVLAENIAGSEDEFAALMNERAAAWGLENSTFSNPTGRDDEGQRMSVLDIARLSRKIWTDYPQARPIFGMESFTWSEITQRNRNPLIGTFRGADGLKTGHTDDSGYGVSGTAERDGVRRFVVLAGLESEDERRREADRMMGLAFSEFDTRTFFNAGDTVMAAEVFGGKAETVPLVIDATVRFTLHRQQLNAAEAKVRYTGPIPAPVRKGEQVAVLELTMPGEETREYPLYTGARVPGLGFVQKIKLGLATLFTPPDEPVFE